MKTNEELKNTPNLLIARTAPDGGCGEIFLLGKRWASVIWSNGAGWEHVSVAPYNRRTVPSWDDMCRVKDMFSTTMKLRCNTTRQRANMSTICRTVYTYGDRSTCSCRHRPR